MRILVFGGSFDPVHRGHLALLRSAARELRPDRIVLLPTGRPPHKAAPAASFADRKALLRAALKAAGARGLAAKTRIDGFEARGPGPHYSYRSLRHLRGRWPSAEFFLLLGSDQLAYFPHWRRREEVLRACRLVAGLRRGTRRPRAAGVRWLRGTFPPISSSELRRRLAEGRDAGAQLPAGVYRELLRRGLYGTGWIAWLRERLKPARLRHTLAVTRLAGDLARRHGLDPWQARQAALLHDAGRSLSGSRLVAYARRHRVAAPLRETIARREPMLLHAYVSADLARRRFGVREPRVLAAIAGHTLGAPGMGPLERLLYVADAGAEDRSFPGARRIRACARRDLLRALRLAAGNKLDWVRSQGGWVHPLGEATLRWAEKQTDG